MPGCLGTLEPSAVYGVSGTGVRGCGWPDASQSVSQCQAARRALSQLVSQSSCIVLPVVRPAGARPGKPRARRQTGQEPKQAVLAVLIVPCRTSPLGPSSSAAHSATPLLACNTLVSLSLLSRHLAMATASLAPGVQGRLQPGRGDGGQRPTPSAQQGCRASKGSQGDRALSPWP